MLQQVAEHMMLVDLERHDLGSLVAVLDLEAKKTYVSCASS